MVRFSPGVSRFFVKLLVLGPQLQPSHPPAAPNTCPCCHQPLQLLPAAPQRVLYSYPHYRSTQRPSAACSHQPLHAAALFCPSACSTAALIRACRAPMHTFISPYMQLPLLLPSHARATARSCTQRMPMLPNAHRPHPAFHNFLRLPGDASPLHARPLYYCLGPYYLEKPKLVTSCLK